MVEWDVCDHVLGIRNVSTALFYDVGDARVNGHDVGPTAHAVGAGLRMDVAVFGFVEHVRIGDHRAQLGLGDGAVIVADASHGRRAPGADDTYTHSVMVRVDDCVALPA